MAFTYSANIQVRVGMALFGVPYSSLTANQKAFIDGTWTTGALTAGLAYDAWNELAQVAQWFEQASSTPDTSLPQPAWESLFVAKLCWKVALSLRPDRATDFSAEYEKVLDSALDSFSKSLASGTTMGNQTFTPQAVGYYVINHCVRRKESGREQGMRRRIFPPPDDIDAHFQAAVNEVWNMRSWNFRKRIVHIRAKAIEATAGTFVHSTKVLTATFGTYTRVAGDRFYVTAGTDAVLGDYMITANNSTTLTLDGSLADTAASLTTGDITGTIVQTTIQSGLSAAETIDALTARKLYFTDATGAGNQCVYCNSDEFSTLRAYNGVATGRPTHFRVQHDGAGGFTWHFTPIPDQTYTFKTEVQIASPTTWTNRQDTAPMATFPPELRPAIRELVLAKVLLAHGASDGERFYSRAMEQIHSLGPAYEDLGTPQQLGYTTDMYRDVFALTGDGNSIGGPM